METPTFLVALENETLQKKDGIEQIYFQNFCLTKQTSEKTIQYQWKRKQHVKYQEKSKVEPKLRTTKCDVRMNPD